MTKVAAGPATIDGSLIGLDNAWEQGYRRWLYGFLVRGSKCTLGLGKGLEILTLISSPDYPYTG